MRLVRCGGAFFLWRGVEVRAYGRTIKLLNVLIEELCHTPVTTNLIE